MLDQLCSEILEEYLALLYFWIQSHAMVSAFGHRPLQLICFWSSRKDADVIDMQTEILSKSSFFLKKIWGMK